MITLNRNRLPEAGTTLSIIIFIKILGIHHSHKNTNHPKIGWFFGWYYSCCAIKLWRWTECAYVPLPLRAMYNPDQINVLLLLVRATHIYHGCIDPK
jgi:hypothetical protein